MSSFDAFGPLDDLIQVIYQASHRFVFLSRVEFDAPVPGWKVFVGLADAGRWWKGRWEKKDVDAFVGRGVSEQLIEGFVDNAEKAVTRGELFVDGMEGVEPSPEMKSTKIVFNPRGNKPVSIPLTELSPQEAIVFVTNEFFELGLDAQKRKCKLNPPAFQTTLTTAPVALPKQRRRDSPPPSLSSKKVRKLSASPPRSPPRLPSSRKAPEAKFEHRKPLPKAFKEKTPESPDPAKARAKPPLAKRARKVQKMEFASDEE